MSGASTDADADVAHYGGLLRRRWLLIALGLLAGIGIAAAALAYVPKVYTSTASVIVEDTGSNGAVENGRTDQAINLDTEAQIVTSAVVADRAAKAMKSTEELRELVKHVSVTVPPNTSFLNIAFEDASAAGAQRGAHAFAVAYLENRREVADSRTERRGRALQQRIGGLGKQLKAIGVHIADLTPGSPEYTYQNSQRALLLEQLTALNAQYAEITSGAIEAGSIQTDAQVPIRPSDPNPKLLLASGVMAGLLGGVVLAFARDRADTRVRDRRDLERLGLDVLVGRVVVPDGPVIASPKSSRNNAESMRQLRNALLAQLQANRRSIMVAGMSGGGEGSAVALNLAATLARSGIDVILVVADSRSRERPVVDGADDAIGLADLLQGRATLSEVIHEVSGEPGLRLVLPGADGSLYSELLQNMHVRDTFSELAAATELLVVDVAPVSANADAQTLATFVDGVVVVAGEKETRRPQVIEAIDQFSHVSAHVVGAVLAVRSETAHLDHRPVLSTAPARVRHTRIAPEASPR